MNPEARKRIEAAEAAFFSTRKRMGGRQCTDIRHMVQEIVMGAAKETLAEKYGYQICNKNNLLNAVWRQAEFQAWVSAVQDELNGRIQAQYIKEHHKREILSEVKKKEELTEMFYSVKAEGKFKDALSMIQELNKMEGHYAPTKTEVKDTTEMLDDAELDAAIAAELARANHVEH